ncbi:helix-turn-helix domain-containing protein [Streptomonospora algeriensis]
MRSRYAVDGAKLRRARQERGLPVATLARAVGRSVYLIYSIEQGRTQPSDHVFKLLLLLLNVSADEITVSADEVPA